MNTFCKKVKSLIYGKLPQNFPKLKRNEGKKPRIPRKNAAVSPIFPFSVPSSPTFGTKKSEENKGFFSLFFCFSPKLPHFSSLFLRPKPPTLAVSFICLFALVNRTASSMRAPFPDSYLLTGAISPRQRSDDVPQRQSSAIVSIKKILL